MARIILDGVAFDADFPRPGMMCVKYTRDSYNFLSLIIGKGCPVVLQRPGVQMANEIRITPEHHAISSKFIEVSYEYTG